MRNSLFFFGLLLLLTNSAIAQPPTGHSDEFTVFNNGYIYSPQAMTQLHKIVYSLNLRFKTCDLHPRLTAFEQASGHCVYIENPSRSVLKELKKGKSLGEILVLCPQAQVTRNLLIIRDTFTYRAQKRTTTEFFSPQIVNGDEYAHQNLSQPISAANLRRDMQGQWVTATGEDSWKGFYFLTDFQQRALPENYGQMIQYVDCLIDTSAVILLGKDDDDPWGAAKPMPAIDAFSSWIKTHSLEPLSEDSLVEPDQPGYKEYRARLDVWRAKNATRLHSTSDFTALRAAALQEAQQYNISSQEFEEVLLDAGLESEALEMKRRRRVWGSCSHDDSPRLHAQAIAELAAETVQWDIFLRAHLD
ncbi:MAG: hypothetical protein LH618_06010, partial [Saprospiraceae bacterium]|nr:hypothetical protein [Saprospiraceae bacterium]